MENNSNQCAVCGVSFLWPTRDVDHIQPRRNKAKTPVKFALICSNCNAPRGIEFSTFLADLLSEHPSFTDIVKDAVLEGAERLSPDILASRNTEVKKRLAIECKTEIAYIGPLRMQAIADYLRKYAADVQGVKPVFAVPATLNDELKSILVNAKIEVWDLPVLADLYRERCGTAASGFYSTLLENYLERDKHCTREEELISRLSSCKPGKADWLVYQKLIVEILEHLFYPPLNKPVAEISDKPKVNRRDVVIANYAESGFWAFMRNRYQADYLIVDAKNYTKKVRKPDILQIANYLKPHGAGLFGVICSRLGGDDRGCEHTLREQWLIHQKLILVLNDDDISSMLTAKAEQRGPEEILAAKIEAFRLSM